MWICCVVLTIPMSPSKTETDAWTYSKLFETADRIVIARAKKTVEESGFPEKPYLVGVVTTFEVLHTLKGEGKEGTLLVRHLGYVRDEKIRVPDNGPLLVRFLTKRLPVRYPGGAASLDTPQYLLFLRKQDGGRYECVSGQLNPTASIKQLHEPFP